MSKITESANGEDCALRIYPHCCFDTETTVLAHIQSNSKGMAIKSEDWWAVYACSVCHDIIDGRFSNHGIHELDIQYAIISALHETQKKFFDNGLLLYAQSGED